jgi:hypothetical protein
MTRVYNVSIFLRNIQEKSPEDRLLPVKDKKKVANQVLANFWWTSLLRVVTVRRSTEFAKCQSLPWKTSAYPSGDQLWSEFPADSRKRKKFDPKETHKSISPTKANCKKLVKRGGTNRSSTFRDLSFLQIFEQKEL